MKMSWVLTTPEHYSLLLFFGVCLKYFKFYWYYSQYQKWKFVRVLIEINKQCVPNIKNEFNTECKVKSCSLLPEYVPCPLCCCLSLFGYPCYTAHLLTPSAAPSIESTAAGEVRLYKVRRFALTETAPNSPLASFFFSVLGGRLTWNAGVHSFHSKYHRCVQSPSSSRLVPRSALSTLRHIPRTKLATVAPNKEVCGVEVVTFRSMVSFFFFLSSRKSQPWSCWRRCSVWASSSSTGWGLELSARRRRLMGH